MPLVLLVILLAVLSVVGILCLVAYLTGELATPLASLCSGIPALLLLTWLIIACAQPKEVVSEETLTPFTLQEGRKSIQTAVITDSNGYGKLVNLNDALHGNIPENAKIRRTKFKQVYYGIDFMDVRDEYTLILSPLVKKE